MSRDFLEGKGETVDAQVGELVLTAVVVVWAVTIMYWDFSFQRIPNALTLPAIAIAVGLGLWLHPFALVSGAVCAGMYYVLYRQQGVGAGDVKLVASLGVLWDWEECTLGKPRPTGVALSAVESAEWVLGLVEKGELPEVDLECIERMGLAADRRRSHDRWLMPLLFLGGYVIAIGLIVSSIFSGRVWTSFTAGVLLVNLLIANLKPSWLRLRNKFKKE